MMNRRQGVESGATAFRLITAGFIAINLRLATHWVLRGFLTIFH
jgi:hypothetical protein